MAPEDRPQDDDQHAECSREIACLLARVAELERVADENYADLLDQMDEAWGSAREIGREEITAFISSRVVHRPTASLRARVAELERERYAAFAAVRQHEVSIASLERVRDRFAPVQYAIEHPKFHSIEPLVDGTWDVTINNYRHNGKTLADACENHPELTPGDGQGR